MSFTFERSAQAANHFEEKYISEVRAWEAATLSLQLYLLFVNKLAMPKGVSSVLYNGCLIQHLCINFHDLKNTERRMLN